MSDWTDGPVRVLIGDVRTRLCELPDASVHCVVTSPPYWGLRDYGVTPQVWGGEPDCEHEWGVEVVVGDPNRGNDGSTLSGSTRNQQAGNRWRAASAFCRRCGAWLGAFGLEPSPEMYVEHLVEVFREVRRVVRPDGTAWLNLGDSYAGNRGNADEGNREASGKTLSRRCDNAPVPRSDMRVSGLKPKDMVGIPWRVALALQAAGWWLRSDIIWAKPNPMPESVTDRPTTAHEHVFLLAKAERYFYDADAVREAAQDWGSRDRSKSRYNGAEFDAAIRRPGGGSQNAHGGFKNGNHAETGRNLRSVWTIATQPYPEAHFATFPEELARRCIAAGTSERGCCPECGAPWRRTTSVEYVKSPVHGNGSVVGRHYATGQNNFDGAGLPRLNKHVTTTGWGPGCTHAGDPVPCTALDPFAGSGTTLAVARRMGRAAIGIELQADYLPLIRKRVSEAALPLLEHIGPLSRALGGER